MRRVVVSKVAIGGLFLASLLGYSHVASAKPPTAQQKKAATEAFKQCRDQEQYGDATACWRAWLEKHRSAGGEAELMVAEERVAKKSGDPGVDKPKKKRATKKDEPKEGEAAAEQEPEEETEEEEEEAPVQAEAKVEVKPEAPPEPALPPANETLQLFPGSSHRYIISPGKAEGVAVGASYVVNDGSGNLKGYLKVFSTGPGGSEGASQPSELSLRLGEVDEGAAPVPKKTVGLSVMLHGSGAAGLMNDGSNYFETPAGGFLEYAIPGGFVGGGLSIGYELSGPIGWSESHLRLRGEFLAGLGGTGTKANAIPIELLFEKGFYLGKALTLYGALGPSYTIAIVETLPPPEPIEGNPITVQQLQANRLGGAVSAGLEVLLSPNVALRLEGNVRINMRPSGYTTSDGGPIYWNFHTRKDSYSMGGGRLGVIAKF